MSGERAARTGWADALRCLSALAVVLLHCAGATLASDDPGSTRFLALNLLDGGSRWAVPVFVMLSGMFLLDPDRPMPRRKWLGHVGRLAVVTLLWSFLYALYDARAAHFGLEWFLEALIRLVKGELHYHLWFLPMLLGLYLLVPPLRALARGGGRRTLWYLVGLWGAVAVGLNTFYGFFPGGLFRPWLELLQLNALWGYGGYFLLGYLLATCQPPPWAERLAYLLGLLGLGATWLGTQWLSRSAGAFQEGFYGYLTPNVCLTAVAVFLLSRRLDRGRCPAWAEVSRATLGVYLLHPLFLDGAARLGLPRPEWNVAWAVPLEALAAFALSLGASLLLRRIPRLGKYFG